MSRRDLRWSFAVTGGWLLLCAVVLTPAVAGTVMVTVKPAKDVVYRPLHEAPARIISANDAVLSAELSAIVTEIPVRVGERLAAGGLMAKLDCDVHLHAVEQAWAEMLAAQARAESAKRRFSELEKSAASRGQTELPGLADAATLETVEVAEAIRLASAFRQSQARTKKCEIRAPFDAVVVARIASVGELVTANSPVVRVLDAARVEAIGRVPEHDIASLREADDLQFIVANDRYPVTLRAVLPLLADDGRNLDVRLELDSSSSPPLGSAGRIEWKSQTAVLPSNVLVRSGRGVGIFIVTAGKARYVPVEGARDGNPAPIPDIASDALIVVEGRHALADGDAVKVAAAQTPRTAAAARQQKSD